MEHAMLPNGSELYWKPNCAGGRTYYTDECAVGHEVWDTCLTQESTLIAAIHQESIMRFRELHEHRQPAEKEGSDGRT